MQLPEDIKRKERLEEFARSISRSLKQNNPDDLYVIVSDEGSPYSGKRFMEYAKSFGRMFGGAFDKDPFDGTHSGECYASILRNPTPRVIPGCPLVNWWSKDEIALIRDKSGFKPLRQIIIFDERDKATICDVVDKLNPEMESSFEVSEPNFYQRFILRN